MKLSDLTVPQLERAYQRIYRTLGSGGHFGWDWRTLATVHPGKYRVMKDIAETIVEKTKEVGEYE